MYVVTVTGELVQADDGTDDVVLDFDRYQKMVNELTQLREKIRTIELAHLLETGNVQSIEPPGDNDDYLFSEN